MKKALALVLALVLALSMAVSAFGLVVLEEEKATGASKIPVAVVPSVEKGEVLYASDAGTYYIALEDKPYTDIKVSTNGIISAELVEYNPDTMAVTGMDIFWCVTRQGKDIPTAGLSYETAKAYAADFNTNGHPDYPGESKVTYYGYRLMTNVNIIKVTVAENYGVAHKEGSLTISAKLDGKTYSRTLTVINDVTIFEYEQVKWAANTADAYLVCGDEGYSEYDASLKGYNFTDDKYDVPELRTEDDAAVVSTTAFRAIAGKNLVIACDDITVTLKAIAAGQKGVNFKHYTDIAYTDLNGNFAYDEGEADAIEFGFYGDQVVLGDFTVKYATGYTWFTLREAFGEQVEEDDIISYYVLKNGKVVKEIVVDYMTADIYQPVVVELAGSNSTLGQYQIVMEVPAVEGETNPNTGAESVVGVVAALAVVSVATAAAVSLKK
ncbi:MAG: hypothetical protein IKL57_02940 [Oscillospiraceae bacterium]|nr:hypothetical protein [Oscillospiraceae bacterium]